MNHRPPMPPVLPLLRRTISVHRARPESMITLRPFPGSTRSLSRHSSQTYGGAVPPNGSLEHNVGGHGKRLRRFLRVYYVRHQRRGITAMRLSHSLWLIRLIGHFLKDERNLCTLETDFWRHEATWFTFFNMPSTDFFRAQSS